MDGVERVMVLGILAVIVAILSFAWSATDESATPVGALGRGPGSSGTAIPLSSTTPHGDSVVLDEAARSRISEQWRANTAAKEAQLQQRRELMNAGQAGRGAKAPGAAQPGAMDPTVRGARGPLQGAARANGQNGQSQVPNLPDSDEFGQTPRGNTAARRPAGLPLPAPGVQPSTRIPLRPVAALNEGRENGSDEPPFRLYTVVEGDTLWGIAYRGVGAGDTKRMLALIEQFNPGLDSSSLSIGRTIRLPLSVRSRLQNKTPTERAAADGGSVYIVAEGDTLGAIATNELGSGGRWVEIYQLNKAIIPDPERIRPGQRLILPDE